MHECHNELLMNIPDEELEKLADMYREHGEIPYASSVITNGIRVRKKRGFYIRFMSPGNCWRDDGTFFAVMEFPHSYDLAVFSLDKSGDNVYEGLFRTRRLHYERPLLLYAIHNIVYPSVVQMLEDRNIAIKSDDPHNIFSMPKEKALEFQVECPPEVELRRLRPLHSKTIDAQWADRFPHSQEFLSALIELVGGVGLFMRVNNELVSWGVLSIIGQLGIIQTVEAFRRKGYATIITKVLSKQIAELGENPTAMLPADNVAMRNLLNKLDFDSCGQCNYISLVARSD